MNKVVLIGRLTKDPELRYTPGNGIAVSSLTLAVDNYNSKTGEKGADFIPVVVWGKSAENVAQYCTKGSQIAVSGRITNRSYDAKDGTKRYITEVVADMFNGITFLSSNNASVKNNNSQSDFGTPVEQEELPF